MTFLKKKGLADKTSLIIFIKIEVIGDLQKETNRILVKYLWTKKIYIYKWIIKSEGSYKNKIKQSIFFF